MPSSQITYSVNIRLGGGGMGSSVQEMVRGLHAAGMLKQLIVSSVKATTIPSRLITAQGFWGRVQKRLAFYERTGWGDYIISRWFDQWASHVMLPADIFEGWTGIALTSLQVARARGMRTFVGLGSAHPRTLIELMNVERRRWGLAPLRDTPFTRQIEQELVLADRVIIQSRFSERTLIEHGVPADKLARIPLGVDVQRFCPAPAQAARPFRVLFVGQVMLRKGVQYLLEAWQQLAWRDAELWLVGKVMPDCAPVLRHYANLPGVRLLGYVPSQIEAYQTSDVLVAPSVEDGFGLVVPEAMACGLPVIVSDHTGAADLVQAGASGFVVKFDAPEAYARALETLRANPERAREMGHAGRAMALSQTWDAYRTRLIDIHHQIMEQEAR